MQKELVRNPDHIVLPAGALFPLAFEAEDTIEQYRAFIEQHGGFDPWNATLTPMSWAQEVDEALIYSLSSIAGALEAGMIHKTEWPHQLFKTEEDLDEFIYALSDYPERLRDRHFRAMGMLSGDIGACTNEELAESLREAADAEAAELLRGALKAHNVI